MGKARKRRNGPLEIFDDAGNLIATQKLKKQKPTQKQLKKRKKVSIRHNYTEYVYDDLVASKIVQGVREGKTIRSLGRMKSLPPEHIIRKWFNKYKDFKAEVDQAIKDQADHYKEKVIDTADSLEMRNKSDVPVAKAKMSAYKYGAEKGNPEKYGKQESGDGKSGFKVYVINTGINREPIEVPNTEVKQIPNQDESN